MRRAAVDDDTRSFMQLAMIFLKSSGDTPAETEQPELFVVDRRREPAAA